MSQEQMLESAGLYRGDIDELLKRQQGSDNQSKELLKGTTDGDIRTKTDLSAQEVKDVALARYYAKIIGSKKIADLIEDLLYLKVSKERKSRKEYVESLKSSLDSQGGFLNNMFGGRN